METWDAIRARRNVRQYTDQPLARADLERILDAGRRAASASNWQPWNFVVVTDRPQLVELAKVRGGYDNITLAVLPLEGRLHEEEPIGPRKTTRKSTIKSARRTKRRRKLSTGQRVVVAMALSLISIVLGVVAVLLGLGS